MIQDTLKVVASSDAIQEVMAAIQGVMLIIGAVNMLLHKYFLQKGCK